MIPNFPTLVIRFNIDKINSVNYGFHCWKVFWQIVKGSPVAGSPRFAGEAGHQSPVVGMDYLHAAILYEGDSNATLCGNENVFCIGIQSLNDSQIMEIKKLLEGNTAYSQITAERPFRERREAWNEPLVEAGRIDAAGNLLCEGAARQAFESIQ